MPSAQGIRAGAAYIELYTKDSRLVKGLAAASARLKAFGAAVQSAGGGGGPANIGKAKMVVKNPAIKPDCVMFRSSRTERRTCWSPIRNQHTPAHLLEVLR